MDNENFKQYLKDRYYDQIDWYDRKSGRNQKIYKQLQFALIALSSATPVLIIIDGFVEKIPWLIIIPTITSVAVAILASSITAFRFQENWINYRTTCETLRKEIYLHDALVGEYSMAKDKEALFVERVESLLSKENTLWLAALKAEKQK